MHAPIPPILFTLFMFTLQMISQGGFKHLQPPSICVVKKYNPGFLNATCNMHISR